MRFGLLSDIHEDTERLAGAIRALEARNVDRFIILGDICEDGSRIDETVAMLATLPGFGVWGNHDLGLCGEVDPSLRAQFSAAVLDYCSRLAPRVELAGSLFQHIDPHLDPDNPADFYVFPTTAERISGFASCPHGRVFVGHKHAWSVLTPEEELAWSGEARFAFESGLRYLTTVHAVMDGWCAVYDSGRDDLEPIRVG